MLKQGVLLVAILFVSSFLKAQPSILQEDFKENTSNVTSLSIKTLSSGDWYFYYTDKNYNSTTECAVLKYSSSNMGYIITPQLDRPSVVSFDARTVGDLSNELEIQKSVNGGNYITVNRITISGNTYKQYSVAINEQSNNVRIKFMRTPQPSESSNYNIMLDNVKILGTGPTLKVYNQNSLINNGQVISLPISQDASSIEFPITLTNTGNDNLEFSDIKVLGMCDLVGDTTISLIPGGSLNLGLKIDCANKDTAKAVVIIDSNTSDCSPFIFKINNSIK